VIDLAAAVRSINGISVFSDHADPDRFHYLPIRPAVRRESDGSPEFRLLAYRVADAATLGGGLLTFTVDLSVAPDALATLRSALVAQVGRSGITLGPIWPDSGTCRLILLDAASSDAGPGLLVDRILGGADPALAADCATLFATVLEPAAVSIVEGAVRAGGLPVGVVYTLQVPALRPALRARIQADYKAANNFFESRLHGGRLLVAADIGPTFTGLVEQEILKVTVDELVPDADRDGVYQRALDAAQQYVLDTLFTPTLGPGAAPADSTASQVGQVIRDIYGLFTLTFSLRDVHTDELKTMTYDLSAARAETITLAPQGVLSVLLDGVGLDRILVEVPPGPPTRLDLDVACLADLAAEGIDHIDVNISYAGTTTPLLLDRQTTRTTLALDYAGEPEAGYTFEVHFAADGPMGLTEPVSSNPATSDHGVIRVLPRQLYRRDDLRLVLQGVPPDRWSRVVVDVEAHELRGGWSHADTVELASTHPEATLSYRSTVDGVMTLRQRARYIRADGEALTRDWAEVDPGVLVLGDPEPDIVDVAVLGSARFGDAVRELVVDLRPAARPAEVTTLTLTQAAPDGSWAYAANGTTRGYEYRVTVISTLNEVHTGAWLPGPVGVLTVGEGFTQLRTVQCVFLGPKMAALGLIAVKVRFSFSDSIAGLTAEKEFLIEDTAKPCVWTYPVADPSRQEYTVQITRIGTDGTSQVQPPETTNDLLHVETLMGA
jgi:hypothetical protein